MPGLEVHHLRSNLNPNPNPYPNPNPNPNPSPNPNPNPSPNPNPNPNPIEVVHVGLARHDRALIMASNEHAAAAARLGPLEADLAMN